MCNNCIHKAVCSIYRATGGVKKCEHFKEERKGHWIIDRENLEAKCSECGRKLYFTDEMQIEFLDDNENFCYRCGADMRGAEDGN